MYIYEQARGVVLSRGIAMRRLRLMHDEREREEGETRVPQMCVGGRLVFACLVHIVYALFPYSSYTYGNKQNIATHI